MRYELYVRINGDKKYKIKLEDFSVEDVNKFGKFLHSERLIYKKYPKIYDVVPYTLPAKKTKPQLRGDMSSWIVWTNEGILSLVSQAGETYSQNIMAKPECYGTPSYITIEERDRIVDFDLSANPSLEEQRDIFIFNISLVAVCLTDWR